MAVWNRKEEVDYLHVQAVLPCSYTDGIPGFLSQACFIEFDVPYTVHTLLCHTVRAIYFCQVIQMGKSMSIYHKYSVKMYGVYFHFLLIFPLAAPCSMSVTFLSHQHDVKISQSWGNVNYFTIGPVSTYSRHQYSCSSMIYSNQDAFQEVYYILLTKLWVFICMKKLYLLQLAFRPIWLKSI